MISSVRGISSRLAWVALLIAVAVAGGAAAAFATTPNSVQYNEPSTTAQTTTAQTTTVQKTTPTTTGEVGGKRITKTQPPKAAPSKGTLPFTGTNLAFAAGVAFLLLFGGVALRRISRKRGQFGA
jgi:hypothetical protein